MKLTVLASGSRANGYLLEAQSGEILQIECGTNLRETLMVTNYESDRIAGCLVSHEHGDHARHVQQYISRYIPCYMSQGTAEGLQLRNRFESLTAYKQTEIEGFSVVPFPTHHDANEPLGFLIHHEEMGNLLFATDTRSITERFEGLNHLLLETNYSLEYLEESTAIHRNRVLASHLSLETATAWLNDQDLSEVNNIVLIHLSQSHANPTEFQKAVEQLSSARVEVARKGLVLNLNKTPF